MEEVKQTVYKSEDGLLFESKQECIDYEVEQIKEEKLHTYWQVTHNPDLTEGRGSYGRIYIRARITSQYLVEDYCYRILGRPAAFVQGCSAVTNWKLYEIDKDKFDNHKVKARVGDYSYDYTEVHLKMGQREEGLVPIEEEKAK